jgi:hypothetical protein
MPPQPPDTHRTEGQDPPTPDGSHRASPNRRANLGALVLGYSAVLVPAVADAIAIAAGGAVWNGSWDFDCGQGGWGIFVLIPVPLAFAAGGFATLVLARRLAPEVRRSHVRVLGTIAIVLAVLSVPVNFFVYLFWFANCAS